MSTEIRRLALELETREADRDQRTVPASLSSETPVDSYDGPQVLEHSDRAVDLSRAPLPLLAFHDHESPVGIVENVRVIGGQLRGLLRFGRGARASEMFADVADGVLRNLSIGFQIDRREQRDGVDYVTRWTPFEASIVAVPADATVGIGRGRITMSDDQSMTPDPLAPPNLREPRTQREWQVAERDRRADIRGLGEEFVRENPRVRTLIDRALDDPAVSVEMFRSELLNMLSAGGGAEPLGHRMSGTLEGRREFQPEEIAGYSVIDAILCQADPNYRGGGFEREISQEIIERTGIKPKLGGLLMPLNLPARPSSLAKRELQWGGGTGSGAPLVGTEHRPDLFVDVMRNRSVALAMGVTLETGAVQNQSIPRKTATAGVNWYELDGVSTITPADATYDNIAMEPHQLAGISSYSWRMLRQGLPATEQLIREDLAGAHAEELDRTVLQGTGVGPIPAGLSILAAAKPTYTGGSLAYSDIVGLEDAVYANNGDTTGSLGFVVASDLVGTLKSTEKIANGGMPIAEGTGGDGTLTMSGYPCLHTNGAPSASVYFGSWSQCWVMSWGGIEIAVNPYQESSFVKGSVSVRIIGDWDIAVRHPESFGFLTTV